jgi:hypothetical protein
MIRWEQLGQAVIILAWIARILGPTRTLGAAGPFGSAFPLRNMGLFYAIMVIKIFSDFLAIVMCPSTQIVKLKMGIFAQLHDHRHYLQG